LDQLPDLLGKFAEIYEKKQENIGQHRADWEWGESELRNIFRSFIVDAAKVTQLRIYVDALDECGAPAAKSLVTFSQDITSKLPDEAALQVCFSCRHYPLLALQGPLEIWVENENRRDIRRYVHQELQRNIRDEKAVELLEDAILANDSGIFQWAVLIVSIVTDLFFEGTRL
jgi:hypothetical protein